MVKCNAGVFIVYEKTSFWCNSGEIQVHSVRCTTGVNRVSEMTRIWCYTGVIWVLLQQYFWCHHGVMWVYKMSQISVL